MKALQWSIRRELWENRSLYLAPLGAAAFIILAFITTASGLEMARRLDALDPAKQTQILSKPYEGAAIVVMATAIVVAFFYAIDALYGERRDRSILFWKSMPVPERTTVIAKASMPMLVVPAIALVVIIVTQLVMLMIGSAMLMLQSASAAPLWLNIPHGRNTGALVFTLIAITLWYAPLYAWCLAVSAWAPRMPFVWVFVPWVALAVIETFIAGTHYLTRFINKRFTGVFDQAFTRYGASMGRELLPGEPTPDPSKFFSTPDLWLGLVAAGVLLAAAVWLRRRREPT